jgi:hypothetical protein
MAQQLAAGEEELAVPHDDDLPAELFDAVETTAVHVELAPRASTPPAEPGVPDALPPAPQPQPSVPALTRGRTGVVSVEDLPGEGDGCDRCFGQGCDEEACCPIFWQDEGVPPIWPLSWVFKRDNKYLNDNGAAWAWGHCGLRGADRERKVLMGTALGFTVVSMCLTTFGCLGLSPDPKFAKIDAWCGADAPSARAGRVRGGRAAEAEGVAAAVAEACRLPSVHVGAPACLRAESCTHAPSPAPCCALLPRGLSASHVRRTRPRSSHRARSLAPSLAPSAIRSIPCSIARSLARSHARSHARSLALARSLARSLVRVAGRWATF